MGGYVAPLMAQAMLAGGAAHQWGQGGGVLIGGAVLVSSAGKPYVFRSQESADMWCAIAAQRALRELELVAAMDSGRRAVFLERKREALNREARARVNAAGRLNGQAVVPAVLADADFALNKWAHY